MVAAAMKDVDPSIVRMKHAQSNLSTAINENAADESKTAAMNALKEAIEKFDERAKIAKGCIPKVVKPKTKKGAAPPESPAS